MKKSGIDQYVMLFFLLVSALRLEAGPSVTDNHIKVDQFGYRCNDQKIAVISNPQSGYNSGSPFTPGTGANQYQIRDWTTNAVVFSGTLVAWNGGATHAQSGDRVWWFDFSGFTTSGSYYVFDATNNVGSYRFDINDQVYLDVLRKAVRSFYYQRCGVAKTATYAGTGWADASCHIGTQQDADCRLYNNTNVSTSKNLSGGWHDAGDYNKYVNFTWETLTDLLLAYEENTAAWTDDYNIPESGNGVPDVLDEIKFELDWLLKMQQGDGSVLSIVGGGAATPPSSDAAVRRYGPASTSATLTCASVFALASKVYASLGIPVMTTYAGTLQTAAVNAWTWANANTNVQFRNNDANAPWFSAGLGAGQQEVDDYGRLSRKVAAACFLYAITGNATYRTFFDANYNQIHLVAWTSYAYPFETTQQDMMLYYGKVTGATPAVVTAIQNSYTNSMQTNNADNLPNFINQTDAYRAYLSNGNYTWGSNSTKSRQGNMFMNMIVYNLNAANATNYRNAASGFVHYMHGINPNAIVYLSNMNSYGAENSANEFYHSWFYDGSALWDRVGTSTYGPAPGFVPGGPNPTWSLDGCCPGSCGSAAANAQCVTLTPPSGQPQQKAYRDWNSGWPQNSWSITENGIYYQAAYIRVLSKFTGSGTCGVSLALEDYKESPETHPSVHAGIHLYPNPFMSEFILQIEGDKEKLYTVTLCNVQGVKSIPEFSMYGGEQRIIGNGLSKGAYFVKVTGPNAVHSFKILKAE